MKNTARLTCLIILYMCATSARADYCHENFTLGQLPGGILKEAVGIIITGTIANFTGCPGQYPVEDTSVKFLLYTRNNPNIPILLDQKNPTYIDPSKRIKILIPGWLCAVTNARIIKLKNAYLQREDVNVIGIDWTAVSIDLYSHTFCNIPGVAKIIGSFLCILNSLLHINLGHQVHMVGHSMGGQISGISGQEVREQCNQLIGRITALDPAGPLYQNIHKSRRLDETDAASVDVVHSNQALLGYYDKCGTVDFYPNCGTFQPGCMKIDPKTPVSSIIHLPVGHVNCNHLRSLDYMIESIEPGRTKFIASSCRNCPGLPFAGPCIPDILGKTQTVMGEDCPRHPPAEKFYLETNGKPPFAQGQKRWGWVMAFP